jgi:hypothetical protein
MRPSLVLCSRKRVVDSLTTNTRASQVRKLTGLSDEDYKRLTVRRFNQVLSAEMS